MYAKLGKNYSPNSEIIYVFAINMGKENHCKSMTNKIKPPPAKQMDLDKDEGIAFKAFFEKCV